MFHDRVRPSSPTVADALADELARQRDTLAMIASENHVSEAVLAAQGSVLTNKYAEGTPGDRYYGGCEHADRVESLAIEHARELFDADHVNVQPHSGSQANAAAMLAVLEPGDTVLSAGLRDAGHLSHGHAGNLSGRIFEVERYGLDPETGRVDYEGLRETAERIEPDMIVSGFSAYPREVDWERIQAVAAETDAVHLADIAHVSGLVAAGVHASPVGVADIVTGSTHKTIRAGRGGIVMCDETHAEAVDRAVMPGVQGGPAMHNVAGKAVGFEEALEPEFASYAEQTVANARALADGLEARGFDLATGGTDTHLVLADLRETHDLRGNEAERALEEVGIVLNANAVPGDPRPPKDPSGVRAGTPALTTRGFDEAAVAEVADCIARVLESPDDAAVRSDVAATVADLCERFPLYE
ncbi:serine hydroxymethyltransferase [Natrinema salsiterrestre]|uniref:Serine hydroxymethyltransferase n=1 Tax=Natrinema salsiterrestre TaxID=2950540 RepID=A0A9Q4Q584_9EURY|nr:serine hydroxymethyltransferase [Natrinema salsiterrestre]MDF9748322.1 serine hydroxymethyltransferase [Natrinema salsiterrestre]